MACDLASACRATSLRPHTMKSSTPGAAAAWAGAPAGQKRLTVSCLPARARRALTRMGRPAGSGFSARAKERSGATCGRRRGGRGLGVGHARGATVGGEGGTRGGREGVRGTAPGQQGGNPTHLRHLDCLGPGVPDEGKIVRGVVTEGRSCHWLPEFVVLEALNLPKIHVTRKMFIYTVYESQSRSRWQFEEIGLVPPRTSTKAKGFWRLGPTVGVSAQGACAAPDGRITASSASSVRVADPLINRPRSQL